MKTSLYIIPTPIGNLEDITLRALRILREVEIILAEDTRQTQKLLSHYSILTKLIPYHQHNEHSLTKQFVQRMVAGEKMALVSDAGTPSISDVGFLLVRECIAAGVKMECLPGATAFIPALVLSGLPSDSFCFEGFLPHKKGRNKRLSELASEKRTIIFYESPFRLTKTLTQLAEHLGSERRASVSREMTKIYEETRRGNLLELATHFTTHPPKGEMVIVVDGK